MGESLIQLSRVGDEGYFGRKTLSQMKDDDIASEKKSRLIEVPAAAVTLLGQALIGIIGCQEFVGCEKGCM